MFLPTELLMPFNTKKKKLGNKMARFLQSYKADLIFGFTHCKCLTTKHFLLATGLHNMAGSRTVSDVLSHLGHSVDCGKICQIETAQELKLKEIANDKPFYLLNHEMRRVLYQPFSGRIPLL